MTTSRFTDTEELEQTDLNSFRILLIGYIEEGKTKQASDLAQKSLARTFENKEGFSLVNHVFEGIEFGAINLMGMFFNNVKFLNCDFKGTDLDHARFTECHFELCNFEGIGSLPTAISGNLFEACDVSPLYGVDSFQGCEFFKCERFKNGFFHKRSAKNQYSMVFRNMDLSGYSFRGIALDSSKFLQCNLEGVNFEGCNLYRTIWTGSRIDKDTNFDSTQWVSSGHIHNNALDKSETIKTSSFCWSNLKTIENIGLLKTGWILLVAIGFMVSAIKSLNDEYLLGIHLPSMFYWYLLISIGMIASGILYNKKCPEIIQNFTESEWVHQLEKPRHLYLRENLQSPASLALTGIIGLAAGIAFTGITFLRLWQILAFL